MNQTNNQTILPTAQRLIVQSSDEGFGGVVAKEYSLCDADTGEIVAMLLPLNNEGALYAHLLADAFNAQAAQQKGSNA